MVKNTNSLARLDSTQQIFEVFVKKIGIRLEFKLNIGPLCDLLFDPE